jgi:hypothetical protein
MRARALLIERSRIAADLANVEKGIQDLPAMLVSRAITTDRAACVLAVCAEEVKRLQQQLADIDRSVTLLQPELPSLLVSEPVSG